MGLEVKTVTSLRSLTRSATKHRLTGRQNGSPSRASRSSVVLGIAAGIAAAGGFGLANALVHRASAMIPASEITFARALVGVSIALPIVFGRLGSVIQIRAAPIWVAAAAGAISIVCFAHNIATASMALASILFNVFLLFLMVSGAIAGELRITRKLQISFFLIFSGLSAYWFAGDKTCAASVALIGLLGAFAAAVSYTAQKQATKISDPALINWVICVATIPISLLRARQAWLFPTGIDCLLLASIGVVSFSSQYLATLSFVYLPLSLAAALSPSTIVWSLIVDTITAGTNITLSAFVGAIIYAAGICLLAAHGTLNNEHGRGRHAPQAREQHSNETDVVRRHGSCVN
jgi:drug/metabolite transporter (DMT)-like permease